MRPGLKAILLATATAAALVTLGSPAWAGSYVVSACSPSASPGAWAQTNADSAGFASGQLCGGPSIGSLSGGDQGALYAEDILNSSAHIPNGAQAGWTFTAPPGTTIAAVSYYRSLAAYGEPDLIAGLFQGNGTALEQCMIPWPFLPGDSNTCSTPNTQAAVAFTGLDTSSLFFGLVCRIVDSATACIDGGAPLHAAQADLYSAQVTLSEGALPTVGQVGGSLWAGGVVSGVVPVTFAASDASGIQQAVVRSDTGQTLNSATETCNFTMAQPCPQIPAGMLNVDTTHVPNGPHTFSLVLTDAAGNTQVVTSPTVTVNNAPPATSTGPGTSPSPGSNPPGGTPGTTTSSKAIHTKLASTINGARLRVTATLATTIHGKVKVSWRSSSHGRTVASGSRVVTIRDHGIALTFTLSHKARAGLVHVAVRTGKRILVSARAHSK